MVATTHTHTQTHTPAQVFNINPNITKTYEQTADRQQKWYQKNAFVLLIVPAQNFFVQLSEILPENASVPAGGPVIPGTIDVQEQGSTWVPKLYYQKGAR